MATTTLDTTQDIWASSFKFQEVRLVSILVLDTTKKLLYTPV